MNKTPCFSPAHILLPSEQIPVGQWGCVACDQFTSDRSYWEKAAQAAAGGPSTLDLILPEHRTDIMQSAGKGRDQRGHAGCKRRDRE